MIRLVLDTNVWLDWLVFDDPGIAPIAAAVAAGGAEVVVDEAVAAEFARVLGYPFKGAVLDPDRQAGCLARLRALARKADGAAVAQPLPKCSDPDDQKFLELALASGASHLVTKDRALLDLARHKAIPFRILGPAALAAALGSPGR